MQPFGWFDYDYTKKKSVLLISIINNWIPLFIWYLAKVLPIFSTASSGALIFSFENPKIS